MGEVGQKKTFKERLEGKKERIVLWTTLLGLLSAEGIPALVEALSDKPSTAQVQAMIAKRTGDLIKAQRNSVDAIKDLDKRISELVDDNSVHRTVTSRLEGTVDLLKDVLRDCCTRRRVKERLDKASGATGERTPDVKLGVGHVESAAPDETEDDARPAAGKASRKRSPIERLEKLPEFDVQQQLQIQMP